MTAGGTTLSSVARLRREDVDRPVIYVGTGTCGLGAGAAAVLKAVRHALADHPRDADVVEVGCLGLCAHEPMLDVQLPGRARLCFGDATAAKAAVVVHALLDGSPWPELPLFQFRNPAVRPWDGVPFLDEHPFFASQTRWVLENCGLVDPASLEEYVARGGYESYRRVLHEWTPAALCREVERSGLRGRGGGGFLTGRKWRFALETPADQRYLICNADEGDPGAFMDRAVIEGDPYRLLEGLAIAAFGVGASKAYVYIRAEYPLAIARLEHAIARVREAGLLGQDVEGRGVALDIVIKRGAGAFVCGEETALIHSIEGKRGMPRPRPPFPAVKGLFGKPTVINNVETLANLPGLMRRGADAFAAVGTAGSKGTKVFALSGKVRRTGLVEVAMGTRLLQVVGAVGGGVPDGKAFKAVQIGGPSGGCIPASHLDTPIDYESLKALGAMMGSGGLVVMDEDNCMVDVARFFMDFIQRESCGKCIPCREGTRHMLEILEALTRHPRRESESLALERFQGVTCLEQLAGVIQDTSLCGLGQSAPNPVLSTLRWFRDEYEAHVFERRCPAGVCKELLTYSIDPDLCTGCTLCVAQCPSDAIEGEKREPHTIVRERCVACGNCVTVCRRGAVQVS
ncbi:MAG TPA: NADH-ubiquinone oxidoreductase-F iron-sulfur binding region domain-containing protein [Candidatus Krumholzibacteria bacterium]|nr:NADH-ubiquinone oxidoreductase-F iron-sulfur binding region domain-containing protein [Candidatus Krumholzibacteria bacterium]HRX52452.1 NADH-ubiquinone oxidoreductase-F iron-sulfur binding region domain-containing protein [Candidatus Krumholzibacteria bacterium]